MRGHWIAITLLASGCAAFGATATLTVDSTLDGVDATPGDGVCFSAAAAGCTLRAAIQEANTLVGDDTIDLPAGFFRLSIEGILEDEAATGDLDVLGGLVVNGAGAAATIISGGNIDRVFDHRNGALVLTGMTIQSGVPNGWGGGVFSGGFASLLRLVSCRLTANISSYKGGAIYSENHVGLEVVDCLIDGNYVIDGGGSAIHSHSPLLLDGTTVVGNGDWEGGPYQDIFHAIYVWCYHGSEVVTIVNSTVTDNPMGGLGVDSCNAVYLDHATLVDNGGSGLTIGPTIVGSVTMSGSIIAGNGYANVSGISPDCNFRSSTTVSTQWMLDGDDSCGLDPSAGDLPATDPVLLPLRLWGGQAPVRYPTPGLSPVIDAAPLDFCPAVDQRDFVRGGDGNGDGTPGCDLGAVEGGDLVFADGVDNGTTSAWSALEP